MIFDSHAHYDDESFNEDREAVIKELKEHEIVGVLNCGTSIEGSKMSVELANKYEFFYAAVGIHPEFSNLMNEDVLSQIKEMASNKKVRAIGEIGLDYHYEDNPDREVQRNAFELQMKLAGELKLPVVIHDRDAHEDTLNIIKAHPDVKGVIHCFSGSVEFAKECLKLGYYIGITGVVTFKNAKKVVEVVKNIPLDRLLVETDCPYMSPEPFRGKRNRSEYIEYILEKIAAVKLLDVNTLKYKTIQNTEELLKINK